MFDKIETWFNEAPVARQILPFASGLLLVVGLVVMFTSLSGGDEEAAPPPPPPTADLQAALEAAQSYLAQQEDSTFEGFDDPRVAEGIEPALTWNGANVAVEGEITIRAANPNKVLLITRSGGNVYCVSASDKGVVSKGQVDAAKSAQCVGGW